jgi:lipopolysaccharide assembly outer membrane protein LptD (OstA)
LKVNKLTLIIFLLTVVINNSHLFAQEIIKDTLLKIENTDVTILEDEIIKNAQDSIKIDIINRKIFLYGKAEIKYSDIKISAGYIEIDWNTNTITAKPKIDSSGKFIEKPVFEENNKTFKSKEIRYNFKTKKGLIKELNSKEGEGYILGGKVKKTDNDIFYLQKGDYTTCDAEHPHFSIRANKIKLIPGEKIITGPCQLMEF